MSFQNDLVIVFKQSTKDSSENSYGVPQGPLLTYVLGAWFKGRNITLTSFSKKYFALFGLEISQSLDFYGPFNSEEELKKFSYLLAEEVEAEKVNLLPLDMFSKIIKDSSYLDETRSRIKSSSDVMENVEIQSEQTGLFKKLLSKNR